MNSLQNAAEAYQQICKNTYQYTFDNNETILVKFRPQNFCHLAGLRKLNDLREFQYENEKPVYSAINLYQKALAGDFSDYYLQTSTVILFNNEGYNFYLLLGLAEDQTCYYPETFFLRFDDAYIKGQNIVSVNNFKTLPV